MNRRDLLRWAAAAPGLVAGGCALAPREAPAGQRLSLSSVRELRAEHVDPVYGRCRYVADTGTHAVAHPLLVARPGDLFDATIVNRLPQPTTVHFHGLVLPQAQDGAGFDPIPPGGSRRVRFRVHNRGGLYWFHPHPHGLTAEQVHAGLIGLLCVIDEEDAAVDAALALAPSNRIVTTLSDVRARNGLVLPYAPDERDCLHGWIGNAALVDGRLDAVFEVQPGWVRLQLLNACNARGLLLAFEAEGATLPFTLLGTDCGLLAAPVEVERIFLHPAERVDVAVELPRGREVAALSLAFDPRQHIEQASVPQRHAVRKDVAPLAQATVCVAGPPLERWPQDGSRLPLLRLRVREGAAAAMGALPARLSSLALNVAPPNNVATRRWRLDLDPQLGFLIDRTPYQRDEEPFAVPRGSFEVWEIKNSPISMAHPMHLHGPGFRVLRRQGTYGPARALAVHGNGRLATDLGIKDTVTVWPNETVWLLADFGLPPAPDFAGRQRYMFHCHNLEHEDGMMMRNFVVA
jgi:bilirubin oxidase